MPITEQQKEVARWLAKFVRSNGYAPSMARIAEEMGWSSPNAARFHLLKLEEAGVVVRTPRGYLPAETAKPRRSKG